MGPIINCSSFVQQRKEGRLERLDIKLSGCLYLVLSAYEYGFAK